MQLIVAVVLSLIDYTLTTLIHCCCGLSPRLNLTTNSILLVIWLAALGVLCWSMSHTILTSCNATYWGNSSGISVCRIYKTFFSFTATAAASYIASVTLDAMVRKRQTRLGKYDPMASNLLGDLKLEDRSASASGSLTSGGHGHPYAPGHGAAGMPPSYTDDDHASIAGSYRNVIPDGSGNPYAPTPTHAHGRMNSLGGHGHLEQYHAGEAQDFSDVAPARGAWGVPRVRFSAYDRSGYAQPPEQTHYDPGAYR